MSADRVWVTRTGFVRYGSPSSFDTLGKLTRADNGRIEWWAESFDYKTTRLFARRDDAIAWIVKGADL